MAFAMFLQGQHLDLLQFDLIYAMKLKTVGRFPGFFPISYFLFFIPFFIPRRELQLTHSEKSQEIILFKHGNF